MPVSMYGLDLSFMRDPNDKKPPKTRRKRERLPDKRATGIKVPMFLRDEITHRVVHATKTPTLITSRSELRAYERKNGLKEAGDIKPGQIVAENRKKFEAEQRLIKGVQNGWTDFTP